MSDDPEVIPPGKRNLPATRPEDNLPARVGRPAQQVRGVVSATLTGFQAKIHARAHGEIAKNLRAQADMHEAADELANSRFKLARTLHKLEETPDILALDRAQRSADREDGYLDIGHKREMAARRRAREIAEADQGKLAAEHRRDAMIEFKDKKFELGRVRAETRHTEAEIIRARHDEALQRAQGVERDQDATPPDPMSVLVRAREEALDRGDHEEAARLMQAIDVLQGGS